MELKINSKDKLLIVAPHPDDESIGCGGLLALYSSQCDVLLLTDGRQGHATKKYSDEKELVRVRLSEIKKALNVVKVNDFMYLGIPDGKLEKYKKEIYNHKFKNYDYIFVPNRNESHPDHRIVYEIISKVKRKQNLKSVLYEYEVWTPITNPTFFLDISGVISVKKEMIAKHMSQLYDLDYVNKTIGLNCYRGIFNNVEYAEAYRLSEYYGWKKQCYLMLPLSLKKIVKKMFEKKVHE